MNSQIPATYEKKVQCLFCHEPFSTTRIRSRFIRIERVDSDFYQEYKDPNLNPYYYEVDVCPYCGFAFSENFAPDFPPGAREDVAHALKDWTQQNFGNERNWNDAIRTLKLGLFSAMLKKEKHVIIAGLCLRLSWLYRMQHIHNQEQRFLKEALKHYKLSYEQADYLSTKMTDLRLLYMIGELARRIGHEEDAVKYFSRVIQHQHKELEKKTVEMAREQWYKIRNKTDEAVYN